MLPWDTESIEPKYSSGIRSLSSAYWSLRLNDCPPRVTKPRVEWKEYFLLMLCFSLLMSIKSDLCPYQLLLALRIHYNRLIDVHLNQLNSIDYIIPSQAPVSSDSHKHSTALFLSISIPSMPHIRILSWADLTSGLLPVEGGAQMIP